MSNGGANPRTKKVFCTIITGNIFHLQLEDWNFSQLPYTPFDNFSSQKAATFFMTRFCPKFCIRVISLLWISQFYMVCYIKFKRHFKIDKNIFMHIEFSAKSREGKTWNIYLLSTKFLIPKKVWSKATESEIRLHQSIRRVIVVIWSNFERNPVAWGPPRSGDLQTEKEDLLMETFLLSTTSILGWFQKHGLSH